MILKNLEGIPVIGDVMYRDKNCPKESADAMTFVACVRRQYPHSYGVLLTHIRNEGKRKKWQADRDKAEGMVTGAPDFFIPGLPCFLLELKRRDHTLSTISEKQIKYLLTAQEQGAWVCVALGWDSAMFAFKAWLSIQHK